MTLNHSFTDEQPVTGAGRPSRATLRRRANLQMLLAEFAARAMDATAVAELLQCSSTSAYQYLNMLFDNSVIEFCRDAGDPANPWRKMYRLSPDPQHARHFQAKLVDPALHRTAAVQARSRRMVHMVGQASVIEPAAPARRDPLVAALFGTCQAAQAMLDASERAGPLS